ncbi:hypothetical protein K503DRAFT_778065, partial [Rhizopogon vinicolor AM-OR11-026]
DTSVVLQLEPSNKYILNRADLVMAYRLGTGRSRAAVKANRLVCVRTCSIKVGSLINAPDESALMFNTRHVGDLARYRHGDPRWTYSSTITMVPRPHTLIALRAFFAIMIWWEVQNQLDASPRQQH